MFGGTTQEHGRWKQRFRRVFGRTSSDHPTSFDSSSPQSTPQVDDFGNAIVDHSSLEHTGLRGAREIAHAGGAAQPAPIALGNVEDSVACQARLSDLQKNCLTPGRPPSKEKVRNWLKTVPDSFETGPLDEDPLEWAVR